MNPYRPWNPPARAVAARVEAFEPRLLLSADHIPRPHVPQFGPFGFANVQPAGARRRLIVRTHDMTRENSTAELPPAVRCFRGPRNAIFRIQVNPSLTVGGKGRSGLGSAGECDNDVNQPLVRRRLRTLGCLDAGRGSVPRPHEGYGRERGNPCQQEQPRNHRRERAPCLRTRCGGHEPAGSRAVRWSARLECSHTSRSWATSRSVSSRAPPGAFDQLIRGKVGREKWHDPDSTAVLPLTSYQVSGFAFLAFASCSSSFFAAAGLTRRRAASA